MYHLRRVTITALVVVIVVFLLWALPRILNPTPPTPEEQKRDQDWVDSSPYWLDRQACRWLSLCGLHHVKWDPPALPENGTDDDGHDLRWTDLRRRALWLSEQEENSAGQAEPRSWESAGRRRKRTSPGGGAKILEEIPDYVLAYAPLVHLYSGENFWPSDIVDHMEHMTMFTNGSTVNLAEPLNLGNLGELNVEPCTVYMTSDDNVENRPEWLHSHKNKPVPFDDDGDNTPGKGDESHDQWGWHDDRRAPEGTTWWDTDKDHPIHRIADPSRHGNRPHLSRRQRFDLGTEYPIVSPNTTFKPDKSGYTAAPTVLVLVDKGSGILDAFWFFFYSYNLGQTVLHVRYGNHVGDWEHCMTRFENGVPRAMFLSEHAGGKAYAWQALEKRTLRKGEPARPVIYSAVGSHAMYATTGNHPYVLPFSMLKDVTDRGPLWDPSLNTYAYWYDYEVDREEEGEIGEGRRPHEPPRKLTSLTPAASNPQAPTSWFHFVGYWGDETYQLRDERQWRLFGQYHYITGPLGPKFKNLDRHKVCQTEKCQVLYTLEAGDKSAWY